MSFISAFLLLLNLYAQDESFVKKLVGKNPIDEWQKQEREDSVIIDVKLPSYLYDLNQDGVYETILIKRKDTTDILTISNSSGEVLFQKKILAQGINSRIYKMSFHHISKGETLFLIYHYEGFVQYLDMTNTARLYFMVVEKDSKAPVNIVEGPVVWEERESRDHYHQRVYDVIIKDVNNDGRRDLVVQHGTIIRAYSYSGNGRWVGSF